MGIFQAMTLVFLVVFCVVDQAFALCIFSTIWKYTYKGQFVSNSGTVVCIGLVYIYKSTTFLFIYDCLWLKLFHIFNSLCMLI